ncbi:MAG: SLC13/DASS family transporter [Desulfobacteraceae bacterium]|nr:SLC13/DASS family transporter [Desulfobacteraceae bacterium]
MAEEVRKVEYDQKGYPTKETRKFLSGYDKFVNWKLFIFPVVLFIIICLLPAPNSMRDVGTEYKVGPKAVKAYLSTELFGQKGSELNQWKLLTTQIMERNMRMGANAKERFLQRDKKWCKKYKIYADSANLKLAHAFVEQQFTEERYTEIMKEARAVRTEKLKYEDLTGSDKKAADTGTKHIKVAIAMMVFVVLCFLTECIPLPAVAFCIGLILMFGGIVTRKQVAMLYWSDACWFIMGSLMFAAAFVRTGVDKRICLIMFNKLAVPHVRWILLVMFVIISPAASFISDHALAAMFLPIGILLYQNSLTEETPSDPELAKMLMIGIAMACNIGGSGAPSGGARNVIMMTYLEDMFGFDMGYFQWTTYCMPFVIVMIPVTWFMVTIRFKPKITDLGPAMRHLSGEISKMGGWNKHQIAAVIIFLVMLWGWFTEKIFFNLGWYPIRCGIGTIAVAGAVAYLLAGVCTWRDYHTKVDWGVVWLYAGAIIFGRSLDSTGAAYWLARSVLDALAPLGMDHGVPLMLVNNGLTAVLTNLMADGPAAAAVGPISLNMAGIVHPGTSFLPFITMSTAMASSFAYLLIIGTPPNAIVYASGYLEPKDYLRVGIPMWFVANIVIIATVAIYWNVRGWTGLAGY